LIEAVNLRSVNLTWGVYETVLWGQVVYVYFQKTSNESQGEVSGMVGCFCTKYGVTSINSHINLLQLQSFQSLLGLICKL